MFGARGGFLGGGTTAPTNDPYWANVKMLLSARSGSMFDYSGLATPNMTYSMGTGPPYPQILSSPTKFGGYSVLTRDRNRWAISTASASRNATGAFTYEMWWRSLGTSASSTYEIVFAIINILGGQIGNSNANKWTMNTIWGTYLMTDLTAYDQQWHHICFTRNASNVMSYYYDGIVYATTNTYSTSIPFSNEIVFGGAGATDNYSNSYIDDVRLTIGVDRYGGVNFTPPTAQFPTS